MADTRRGTGPNCHCSEVLVKLLMAKFTPAELETFVYAHPGAVLDSVAEAYQRSTRPVAAHADPKGR
jgi:hypothetical protein